MIERKKLLILLRFLEPLRLSDELIIIIIITTATLLVVNYIKFRSKFSCNR